MENTKTNIKDELQLFFGIALGIFLFLLFFEPLGNLHPDVNEKLIFYAGLGGITFFFIWIFRILIPYIFPGTITFIKFNISFWNIIYLLIWIFNSISFVFYIRYVGPLRMSFYIVFEIIIMCFVPVIVLKIKDEIKSLKFLNQALMEKNNKLHILISDSKAERPEEVFVSENKSEILKLSINEIILIKSADNYVELFFKEKEKIQKKLIRNTLRNIETQLKKHSSFIRCHRSYIINKIFIQDLKKGYTGYHLKLSDYKDEVPVSQQYILSIKEAITTP